MFIQINETIQVSTIPCFKPLNKCNCYQIILRQTTEQYPEEFMYHYLQADVSINTIFNTAFYPIQTHTITYHYPAHSHIMIFKMASISFIVIHEVFVLVQRWRIILMKFFGLFCARAVL